MSRPQDAIPKLSRGESVEVAQKDGESASGEALPEGWAATTGDELFEFIRGVSYKKSDLLDRESSDSVAVLRAGNLQDSRLVMKDLVHVPPANVRDEQRLRSGDLVIAMSSGSASVVGKVAIVTEDMPRVAFGAFCGLMRPRTEEVRHWLGQYFQTLDYRNFVSQIAAGININNLRRQHLQELALVVPPPQEMKRLEPAIESLQERSSRARVLLSEVGPLIGQLRQSVLRDAFSGKLTADWRARRRMGTPESPSPPAPSEENSGLGAQATNPAQETASELLLRIRTERRERWQSEQLAKYEAKGKQPPKNWQDKYKEPEPVDESELPELPDGWCWGVMEELCSNIVDCPHSTPKWTESGKLCVRTTEFRAGRLVLTNAKFVSDETFEKRISRLKPAPGDVLYSREGGILGLACQIPPEVELCLGQRMMLMRSEKCIDATLMMHWLNSPFIFNDRVQAKIQGAASPHVNVGEVKRFPIPVPPVEEQQALRSMIEEALAKVESVSTGRASMESSLTQLDQSILSKAFRGELVPQDPRDEPASELLARIRTTRESAAATKKASKKKAIRKKGVRRKKAKA